MNRVDVFQHTPTEPLGYIDKIFSLLNVPFKYHCLSETNEVSARDATRLIFVGGPMSVDNEAGFPWLRKEKGLVRRALKKEIPVLGLCLGAQQVASANGSRVFRFADETGWCRVYREPGVKGLFATFPGSLYVFQMHNETFEIPYGGNLLFTGERVRNQGFRLKSALCFQFHLEMTETLIADWIKDLKKFQREKIARDSERYLPLSNALCRRVLLDFLGMNAKKVKKQNKL